MNDQYTRATAAADYIRTHSPAAPAIGIILGSGLGAFASQVENAVTIPYADIPHFPQSTVVGHSGKLVLGTIGGVQVAVMQGRVHAYEGYTAEEVVFPARVLGLLGCKTLIVTNAAGGIRSSLRPGELVVLSDHINLTGMNAAGGPNEPRFAMTPGAGQRFFDMSEGVYLAVLGPSFETPAEIRAFRTLGADLVGMSTVHEVIIARHMGLDVLGISLVTNMAAGVVDQAIDHEDVLEIGRGVEKRFTNLLTAIVPRIRAS
jgi:purine-nucleoside phosphorylase